MKTKNIALAALAMTLVGIGMTSCGGCAPVQQQPVQTDGD